MHFQFGVYDRQSSVQGSCFIEFHTVEAAHAAIKDGMKFGDKDLENAVLMYVLIPQHYN